MQTQSEAVIDRVTPCRRPSGPASGYHKWSNLLFVHWRVPADAVRPLLPAALTLDTWDGDAWVGLVPFCISGLRPWWSPPCPGVSNFCETNVRTYVHFRGRDPGVWFFSLDAANSLAVRVARWKWHLPYFRAEMELTANGTQLLYQSRRLWPGPAGAKSLISAMLNDAAIASDACSETDSKREAAPGTLEHFLIERYILYAVSPEAHLYAARVHHAPYRLQAAQIERLEQSLLPVAGIIAPRPPCHVAYCAGVSVEIFPLRPVKDA